MAPLPAPAVEHEVCGGDLDGALARHPALVVDHGHHEGVGVAVVDVAPLGVRQFADAVAVAHHGSPSSSRRHIGELLQNIHLTLLTLHTLTHGELCFFAGSEE